MFLLAVFLVGVVVQLFLAGLSVFGETDWDAHSQGGYTMVVLGLLIALAGLVGWIGATDIGLSVLLGVLALVQLVLANVDEDVVAALHPVNALVLFLLAHHLFRRSRTLARRYETGEAAPPV